MKCYFVLLVCLLCVQGVCAQSKSERKVVGENYSVRIVGDFPECDSCHILVVDLRNNQIDDSYVVKVFTIQLIVDGFNYASVAQANSDRFSEEVKQLLEIYNVSDTIRFMDVIIQDKNGGVYYLKPVDIVATLKYLYDQESNTHPRRRKDDPDGADL